MNFLVFGSKNVKIFNNVIDAFLKDVHFLTVFVRSRDLINKDLIDNYGTKQLVIIEGDSTIAGDVLKAFDKSKNLYDAVISLIFNEDEDDDIDAKDNNCVGSIIETMKRASLNKRLFVFNQAKNMYQVEKESAQRMKIKHLTNLKMVDRKETVNECQILYDNLNRATSLQWTIVCCYGKINNKFNENKTFSVEKSTPTIDNETATTSVHNIIQFLLKELIDEHFMKEKVYLTDSNY
ncbi:unnamed protein product [Didymodactylos carnosus]|uniref:NAD(P)-binding domain-containing protein n=1 Tax=Didymodactylos carnosus TaxID=1234261 RepID=A0A8S2F6D1_9BILA|nr:unnamed protein product [Didymodactylos carnosus]CAF4153296.1 unnamed protein product [Didymodactylos carnosus]